MLYLFLEELKIKKIISTFLDEDERDVHVTNLSSSYILTADGAEEKSDCTISVWSYNYLDNEVLFVGGDQHFEQFCVDQELGMLTAEKRWKRGEKLSDFLDRNPELDFNLLFLYFAEDTEDATGSIYHSEWLCYLPLTKNTDFIEHLGKSTSTNEDEYHTSKRLSALNEWNQKNWVKQVA